MDLAVLVFVLSVYESSAMAYHLADFDFFIAFFVV